MREELAGLRVLVVEDEWLVATHLEGILLDAGCEIVGPLSTVAAALRQVEEDGFDIAVLDINLQGEIIWPVVEALVNLSMPFVLTTGYDLKDLQPRYRRLFHCQKPYSAPQVLAAIERAWSGGTLAEVHHSRGTTGQS